MGVIFSKTRKGHDEIENRSGALSPRVRRVLIFVDGKRSVEDLRGMLQSDDLQHTLGMLEEDGFIEMSGPASALSSGAPVASQASVTAFRLHPPGDDPVRLQQARNFMLNTIRTFVGALGTSSLQDRLEAARTHADLRALFDEWYHALVTSRDGRREAEHLRSKLLEIL